MNPEIGGKNPRMLVRRLKPQEHTILVEVISAKLIQLYADKASIATTSKPYWESEIENTQALLKWAKEMP